MDERWQHIESLFTQAASLNGEERRRYLQEQCAGDPGLLQEIESLLNAETQAEDYFTNLARRAGLSSLADDAAGQLVGAYRLLYLLGRGGMGAVYLAERADEQFQKRVAIKLVPIALWGEEARQRFIQERRILARLEHPNIARLLDGGVNADGVPYLVMEYVEGRPIDAYCDENGLDIETRLKLFLEVCEAVADAHRNLVIHRDLKPGNILVARDGMLKLLDFGIAKLVGPQMESGDNLTRLGSRPLTPAYASPELLRGEDITTASDVYALGVLLYKLLSGQLPYALSELSEAESIRKVCETTPPLPSRAVTSESKAIEPSLAHLRRKLAGDLDMITMMALRKEPERRYGSVEQLADDIRRHLADKPVRARPDTATYRFSRFIKRHRVGVAATAALIALAVASGVLITTYAIRVTKQKDQITQERNKAQQEEKFLTGLFNGADPGNARGKTITARELLDRGATRIEKELAGQPAIEADMLDQLGTVYSHLGLYKKAKPLIEKSLQLRRRLYGENDLNTVTAMSDLASAYIGMGDYAAAKPLQTKALEITGRLKEDSSAQRAKILVGISNRLFFEGRFAQAIPDLEQARTLERRLGKTATSTYAYILQSLGVARKHLGDYAAAEKYDREALALRRKLYGEIHPDVSESLNDLAVLVGQQGRLAEAEKLLRESLKIKRKLYKQGDDTTLMTIHNLSRALQLQGKLAEAESYARQAVEMASRIWDKPVQDTGVMYMGYAHILLAEKKYAAARDATQKALAIYTGLEPQNVPHIAAARFVLGETYSAERKFGEAEGQYRKALALYEKNYPSDDWRISRVRSVLGDCLRAQKKYGKAEPLMVAGYQALTTKLGPDHPQTQAALRRLVEFYRTTGNADKADHYRALLDHHATPAATSSSHPTG